VGLASTGGLEAFLQGGFVVADGSAEGVAGLQGEVKVGHGGVDNVLFDECAGGGEATVEIEGGDDGFEGVGEDCGFFAATALLFSAAEEEMSAEVDAGGDLSEMAAADERGAETGEFALAGVWEAAEECFGYRKTEDCVSDKLKLLVVGGWVGEGLGTGFVGERTMCESPGEEFGALEGVTEEDGMGLPRRGSSVLFLARRHRAPLRY
jgi:hypothetical protein